MVNREAEGSGEERLEAWISYVLITGVLVSLVLEMAGIWLYDRSSHSVLISQSKAMFVRGRDFFTFLIGLIRETITGLTAVKLMALGVALLILTPYVRAVMSVVYFASTKNVKYALITAFVVAILTASLMSH